jgi:predicted amidohydrolase
MGADVLAHPSNLVFPNAQEAMRTRSLENRVFTVTANRTGTEKRPGGTVPFTGQSQIVDPGGIVAARAGKRDATAIAHDCDLAQARDKMLTRITPLFSARRPEFYRALTDGAGRVRSTAAKNGDPETPAGRPPMKRTRWVRSSKDA